MKKIILGVILYLAICPAFLFADTPINVQVNRSSLNLGETLTYKITIVSAPKSSPVLELPKLDNFKILSQIKSSKLSFVKGVPVSTIVYALILYPKDAGRFKIGPSKLKIGDKIYSSAEFEIEVKEGEGKTKISPSLPKIPQSKEPKVTL